MRKFPYIVYKVNATTFLTKSIHFRPLEAEPEKTGITLCCAYSPFDENGRLRDDARTIVRRIALSERVTSGMNVCVVFGPEECEYFEPDGTPVLSSRPPKLGRNLLELGPAISNDEPYEKPSDGETALNLTTALSKEKKELVH